MNIFAGQWRAWAREALIQWWGLWHTLIYYLYGSNSFYIVSDYFNKALTALTIFPELQRVWRTIAATILSLLHEQQQQ